VREGKRSHQGGSQNCHSHHQTRSHIDGTNNIVVNVVVNIIVIVAQSSLSRRLAGCARVCGCIFDVRIVPCITTTRVGIGIDDYVSRIEASRIAVYIAGTNGTNRAAKCLARAHRSCRVRAS